MDYSSGSERRNKGKDKKKEKKKNPYKHGGKNRTITTSSSTK
jgi:hypothetical protein